jgi:AAA-like domain
MLKIGGHPYLIQKALAYLAEPHVSVEQFLQVAHLDNDHYRTHLADLWGDVEADRSLVEELRKVVHSPQPVKIANSDIRQKLNTLGLITLEEGDKVSLRNELYRQYFKRVFQN